MDKSVYFINPFRNHSLITAYTLSIQKPIKLLCPPLLLKVWTRHDIRKKLNLDRRSFRQNIVLALSVFLFILTKVRLLSCDKYVQCFALLARWYVEDKDATIIYYQDYLHPWINSDKYTGEKICEFIIDIGSSDENWGKSVLAIRSASCVVVPTRKLWGIIKNVRSDLNVVHAPYGGDLVQYAGRNANNSKLYTTWKDKTINWHRKKESIIVARCNTFRKGADRLFEIVKHLEDLYGNAEDVRIHETKLNIVIAGRVEETELAMQYNSLLTHLSKRKIIEMYTLDFDVDTYWMLLAQADMFIMLSRKESASLAALEALWSGVPSFITTECGIDVFENNKHGIVADCNDLENLAYKIHRVLTAERETLSMWRENLLRDKNRFTWENYIDRYQDLL